MYLNKLVAEIATASTESLRLKEELDQTRGRLHDEISAALKPSKSSCSSSGVAAAWKKVEPLEKAVDTAGSDMQRKMAKASNLLTKMSEDLPLIIQVLEEPEREKELIEKIQSLDYELEIVQAESVELAAEVERVSDLLKESENQILQLKETIKSSSDMISKQQQTNERVVSQCAKYENLIAFGSEVIKSLEEQLLESDKPELNYDIMSVYTSISVSSAANHEDELLWLNAQLNSLIAQRDDQQLKLLEAEDDIRRLQDEKDWIMDSALNALETAEVHETESHEQVTLKILWKQSFFLPKSRGTF
jgi:chromosome segregation ATPase